jgi:hypothetical protein
MDFTFEGQGHRVDDGRAWTRTWTQAAGSPPKSMKSETGPNFFTASPSAR